MKRLLLNCNSPDRGDSPNRDRYPEGRHEIGEIVLYAGTESPYKPYDDVISRRFAADAQVAEEIFIYFGREHRESAFDLILGLKQSGKNVIMVSCTCEMEFKENFCRTNQIPMAVCKCKGRDEFKRLSQGENLQASVPEPKKPWRPPIVA